MNLQELGRRVLVERRRTGMTQEEVAEKIGKTKAYISALERAKLHPSNGRPRQPTAETVERITSALNVEAMQDDWLVLAGHAPHAYQVSAAASTDQEALVTKALNAILPVLEQCRATLAQVQAQAARLEARLDDVAQPVSSIAAPAPPEAQAEVEESMEPPNPEEAGATDASTAAAISAPTTQWRTFTLDVGLIRVPINLDIHVYGVGSITAVTLPRYIHSRLRLISAQYGATAERVTISDLFLIGLYLIDPRLVAVPVVEEPPGA